MSAAGTTWRVCPRCPPDDNVWPDEAFAAWRAARNGRPRDPVCGVCLFAAYPSTYAPCATCGTATSFKACRGPIVQCRKCRGLAETCSVCKEDVRGRARVDLARHLAERGGWVWPGEGAPVLVCIGCFARGRLPADLLRNRVLRRAARSSPHPNLEPLEGVV